MNTIEQAREVSKRLRGSECCKAYASIGCHPVTCNECPRSDADTIDALIAELEKAEDSRDWYMRRCNELQKCQSTMRDPERTMVCDILANGSLLMDNIGKLSVLRYAAGAQAIPAGYQLVPTEPTEAMCKAADDSDAEYSLRNFGPGVHAQQSGYDHYCAMLAAAPVQAGARPAKSLKQLADESMTFGKKAAAPVQAQEQRKPLTDEQIEMLNFLYGAGELDGVWFGERHPTAKGAFWWRKHLRDVFPDGIKEQP